MPNVNAPCLNPPRVLCAPAAVACPQSSSRRCSSDEPRRPKRAATAWCSRTCCTTRRAPYRRARTAIERRLIGLPGCCVADGWSTHSPEVTLNPGSLKSKVSRARTRACSRSPVQGWRASAYVSVAWGMLWLSPAPGEDGHWPTGRVGWWQVLSIVKAVRLVMTWPLIALNILTILFKLLLG